MLESFQIVGMDSFTSIARDYPALSQFTALSLALGFITFSLGFRKLSLWSKASATEKLLLSLGLGVCINLLVLFPVSAIALVLLGTSLTNDLFFTSNFYASIGCMVMMVIGRSRMEEHPFRLWFKRISYWIFSMSWAGFFAACGTLAVSYAFPHDAFVQDEVLTGHWEWFGTMSEAAIFSWFGWWVFTHVFFRYVAKEDSMIDKSGHHTMIEIRFRRYHVVASISVLAALIIIAAIDPAYHMFSPMVMAQAEQIDKHSSTFSTYLDVTQSGDDSSLEVSYYRDMLKSYVIIPGSSSLPISVRTILLPNPSNLNQTTFTYGYAINQGSQLSCCIYAQLPKYNNLSAGFIGDRIGIHLSDYRNKIIANVSYPQQYTHLPVNIECHSVRTINGAIANYTYMFNITNQDNDGIYIRKLQISSYEGNASSTSLVIKVNDKIQDLSSHGLNQKNLWVGIPAHSRSIISIAFSSLPH